MVAGLVGMTWLAFVLAFEIGFLPMGFVETYTSDNSLLYDIKGSAYVDFEVEAVFFDYFFIGGSSKIYMQKANVGKDFWPKNAEWGFALGARFDFVELGFRHYCMHPIIPWIYRQEISPQWEAAYEEIYLRIEVGG